MGMSARAYSEPTKGKRSSLNAGVGGRSYYGLGVREMKEESKMPAIEDMLSGSWPVIWAL